MNVKRVECTPAAAQLIEEMRALHGDLLFHQSGGCCDGSAPMCYPRGDFKIGQRDVFLGTIEGTPFFMGGDQFEYWKHTALTLDVVPGRGAGFSVEGPTGKRFIIRSRVYEDSRLRGSDEDAEIAALEAAGVQTGPEVLQNL